MKIEVELVPIKRKRLTLSNIESDALQPTPFSVINVIDNSNLSFEDDIFTRPLNTLFNHFCRHTYC